jgi:hypothetical protein
VQHLAPDRDRQWVQQQPGISLRKQRSLLMILGTQAALAANIAFCCAIKNPSRGWG